MLAHPTLTLAVESGSAWPGAPLPGTYVTGLQRARFDAVQTGRGGVVGAKFRPGGFTVLTGIPATQLVDRTIPAERLLPGVTACSGRCRSTPSAPRPRVDAHLDRFTRTVDERYELVLSCVHRLLVDVEVARVEQLAAFAGPSTRTVQRLFRY